MPPPDRSPTDLRDIRAFCLVLDLGSVTAAARALGETKGSVSRRLARLERALGARLVHRTSRALQPSEEGTAYRLRVDRALELFEEAAAAARQQEAPRGLLRVTATQEFAIDFLAPVVARYRALHPAVDLELLVTERTLDFDADQIDVAFRATTGPLPDSPLVATRILQADDFRIGLYAAPAWVRGRPALRRPEDLAGQPILLSFGRRREVDAAFVSVADPARRSRVRLNATLTSNDGAFVRELLLAGVGVGVAMERSVARDVAAGRLVGVLTNWRIEPPAPTAGVYMLHRGGPFMPAKVRAFRDLALAARGHRGNPKFSE